MNKPIIRCSDLPQLLNCAGSRTLKALVNRMDRGDGHEGTMIHWLTAWRLIRELGAEQPDGGLPLANVPAGYKLPSGSDWMVGWFFNHVRHNYEQDWAMTVEVAMAYEFDRFILSGHQDVNAVNRDATACRGSDWKSVNKPVPRAEENEQVLGYTALNARAYENLDYAAFDICQPRIGDEAEVPRVSTLELDKNGIQRCLSSLNDRVNAALDIAMELQTGIMQCAWCDAAIQCPAIRGDAEFMKITLTPELLAKIRKEPDDATLGDIVMTAKILDKPFDDARDIIHERLKANGEVIAGNGTRITAKTSAGSFKVIDPVGLYGAVRELIPDEAQRAKCLSFPMGRLTDGIAEAMNIPKGGKAPVTADGIAKARLHPFAEQGERTILQFN